MKITIEPETDAEKAQSQNKPVVFAGVATMAVVGIPAESPDETMLYWHAPNLPLLNLPVLHQRVAELGYQLTKVRLVSDAAQAKAAPLIQRAGPAMPQFPAGNDRMR